MLAQEELQSELSAVVQSGDMQRKEQVELKVPCAAKLKRCGKSQYLRYVLHKSTTYGTRSQSYV